MAVNLTILMMIQCDSLRTASHQYYHEFGLSFAIKFGRHCPIVVLKMTTIFVIIFTYFSSFFDSTMIAMTWLRHTPRSRGLTLKVFSSFQNVVGCNCLGVFKSGHHQSVYQHCLNIIRVYTNIVILLHGAAYVEDMIQNSLTDFSTNTGYLQFQQISNQITS